MNDVFPPPCRNSVAVLVDDGPELSDAQYMRSPLAVMFTATFLYTVLIKSGRLETVKIIPSTPAVYQRLRREPSNSCRSKPQLSPSMLESGIIKSGFSRRFRRIPNTRSNGVVPNTFCAEGSRIPLLTGSRHSDVWKDLYISNCFERPLSLHSYSISVKKAVGHVSSL